MDSKRPDAQAAHEFTLTAMLPALAGTNLIYGLGMLDSGMTFDYAQALLQSEMLDKVLRSIQGMPISDELFAYDVIRDVGPGGEFITHEHTFAHMREQSQVKLFDRRCRETWEASGSQDVVEKAYAAAREIIATHTVEPLPENVQSELEAIYTDAENRQACNREG